MCGFGWNCCPLLITPPRSDPPRGVCLVPPRQAGRATAEGARKARGRWACAGALLIAFFTNCPLVEGGYGCFTVVFCIGDHDRGSRGGRCFRTPCPNCRAKPFKVLAAAPRPRKKGRFRVAISDRPPSPPKDPRLGRGYFEYFGGFAIV